MVVQHFKLFTSQYQMGIGFIYFPGYLKKSGHFKVKLKPKVMPVDRMQGHATILLWKVQHYAHVLKELPYLIRWDRGWEFFSSPPCTEWLWDPPSLSNG
jgi:hypothetical protein